MVVRGGCNPVVSVLARVTDEGLVPTKKTRQTETRWSALTGGIVLVDAADRVYPLPPALSLRLVEELNGPTSRICSRLGIHWGTDTVKSVMQSKDFAFGFKVFLHPSQVRELKLRVGDEILVGYVEVEDEDKMDLAVEYVRMPKKVAHTLLRAILNGVVSDEPAWSPVTSVSRSAVSIAT